MWHYILYYISWILTTVTITRYESNVFRGEAQVVLCFLLTLHHPVSSCLYSYWVDIRVKGTSLPEALHCWEQSLDDGHISDRHGNHNQPKHRTPPMRGCPVRLIDSCSWPLCNPSCPHIYDKLTKRVMSEREYLKLLGFGVHKMAQRRGTGPGMLQGMLNNGSWVTFLQQRYHGVSQRDNRKSNKKTVYFLSLSSMNNKADPTFEKPKNSQTDVELK